MGKSSQAQASSKCRHVFISLPLAVNVVWLPCRTRKSPVTLMDTLIKTIKEQNLGAGSPQHHWSLSGSQHCPGWGQNSKWRGRENKQKAKKSKERRGVRIPSRSKLHWLNENKCTVFNGCSFQNSSSWRKVKKFKFAIVGKRFSLSQEANRSGKLIPKAVGTPALRSASCLWLPASRSASSLALLRDRGLLNAIILDSSPLSPPVAFPLS